MASTTSESTADFPRGRRIRVRQDQSVGTPGRASKCSNRPVIRRAVATRQAQRDALVRKVRGVSDPDARLAPTASALSLLGLLKHCPVWEERWFQGIVAGCPLPDGWPDLQSPTPDTDFVVDDADTVEHLVARYEHAARISRRIVDARKLDDSCARTDIVDRNLRWVKLSMEVAECSTTN